MNDIFIVIFWIFFIIGIYRLLFKSSKQGCLIIFAVIVVGNILIDETPFESKSEINKQTETEVEKQQTKQKNFYSPVNEYRENNTNKFEDDERSYNYEYVNSSEVNTEYAEDDETEEPIYIQKSYNQTTSEDNYSNTSTNSGVRVGAICNDGTTSTATGSGACSHHGGVSEWIYE